jgi:hypothetical protein
VNRAARTITVPGDPDNEGRARPRRLAVAPSAAAALSRLRVGTAVLLTLRGDTVIDVRVGRVPAARGTQQEVPQLPPTSTSPVNRSIPQLPAGAPAPQARPIPQTAPVTVVTPSPGVSPVAVAPTRPAVSPVAVRSPKSPGTPRPVVLPSDPPPTPIPSPG